MKSVRNSRTHQEIHKKSTKFQRNSKKSMKFKKKFHKIQEIPEITEITEIPRIPEFQNSEILKIPPRKKRILNLWKFQPPGISGLLEFGNFMNFQIS